MNNERKIKLLEKVLKKSSEIKIESSGDPNFQSWRNLTQRTLINVFGEDSFEVKEFEKRNFRYRGPMIGGADYSGDHLHRFRTDFETTKKTIENYIEDLKEDLVDDEEIRNIEHNPIEDVENIFNKFHGIVKIFENRTRNKPPLIIEDEYDVQYLLLPLLRLYFDDIVDEESVPTQGSTRSFIDFLLKDENIAIETKITSSTLGNTNLTKQLNDDIGKYSKHPKVKTLMFFIYNPGNHIKNPIGFIKDFTKKEGSLDIKTYITP